MSELTVSMPAYDTGKYIGKAIESVLCQDGVDFELVVVDDGSNDGTAEIVRSFKDPRIRLIRNHVNRGIAYCHNLVIEKSSSPFIAHVDSDDVLLPGALKKMIGAMKSGSNIGQAHCYFFCIDENGRTTREAFRKTRMRLLRNMHPNMDYKRQLIVHGSVMNALRTYRREVFSVVGMFNERLRYGVDHEMALRIVDKYDIKLVPEFLYCYRIHKSRTTGSIRFKSLTFYCNRLIACQRLLKDGQVHFMNEKPYQLSHLMFKGLFYVLEISRLRTWLEAIYRRLANLKKFANPKYWVHLSIGSGPIYHSLVDHLSWWPIGLFNFSGPREVRGKKRIAYVIWHFPVLSQSFVQREVEALRQAGLSLEVVADAPGELDVLDDKARSLVKGTHYLFPLDRRVLRKHVKYFLMRKNLQFINLFLFVVFHRYDRYKTIREDCVLFLRSVYLAGVLKDKKINHIHSPWADRHAFRSLITSRLLGIPYSVHARAHDIQERAGYALLEKLRNAEFVITNSRYNEAHLRGFLGRKVCKNIHIIYDGLDLVRFEPAREGHKSSGRINILSVGRLIEPKGFLYLLKACHIVRSKGFSFQCNIIGGPEIPSYTDYFVMMKILHRKLALEDCVFFMGALPFDRVLEEYKRADIFVLPCVTAEDGSKDITPNVLMEAMAMELPVISTNQTAIPEIVDHGVNGILVPPKDENVLAEAIIELIQNYGTRSRLTANARKKVEERFEINKNVLQHIALFGGAHFVTGQRD